MTAWNDFNDADAQQSGHESREHAREGEDADERQQFLPGDGAEFGAHAMTPLRFIPGRFR